MANTRSGNSWFVDSSSSSGTRTSFLTDKNLKLVSIIYHVAATTDVIAVYDLAGTAAGNQKLKLISDTAKAFQQVRLENTPIVFPNGVWITLTGSPTATLIFSQQGSS